LQDLVSLHQFSHLVLLKEKVCLHGS
jgi:hypothetical protein